MAQLIDYLANNLLINAIKETEKKIEKDDLLLDIKEKLLNKLYYEKDREGFLNDYSSKMPKITETLEEYADCFLISVFNMAFYEVEKIYTKRKIPERILADTMSDIDIRAQNYYTIHKRAGIDNYKWVTHHMQGKLFKIGRLQFMPCTKFFYNVNVFKSREGQELFVFAGNDVKSDCFGYVAEENEAFVTTFKHNNEKVMGHLISEGGNISRDISEIDALKVEKVLTNGDFVLDIHVSADGKMDFEDCVASLDEAKHFVKKHFPENQYKGFTFSSWLLCENLGEILGEGSNIVRFAKLFRICKRVKTGQNKIYNWIFGFDKQKEDYMLHEAKTTLQKGAKKMIEEGKWFETRAGFIKI